jgi:PAS domain S-box-containing protein
MAEAAPAPQEADRVARLHALQVLDTGPEGAFDALASLASSLLQMPIALVSLVDEERQWFKAQYGLPGVSETARELAFCAHAILDRQVLEVEDALADERFADNALVLGDPHIRFYAGAPIVLSDGLPMGTVCVIDRQPRRLDDLQRRHLQSLATVAAELLESRQARQLADTQHRRLESLIDGTRAATWEIDLVNGRVHSGRWWRKLFGAPLTGDPGRGLSGWQAAIHPVDQPRALAAMQAHLDGHSPAYDIEVRRRIEAGEWRWMHDRGQVSERSADGRPLRLAGLCTDIHEQRLAQIALQHEQALFSAGPCVVLRWHLDANWQVLAVTSNVKQVLGLDPADLMGAADAFRQRVHPDDHPLLHELAAASDDAGPKLRTVRMHDAQGQLRWVELTLLPEHSDGHALGTATGYLIDVSARMSSEQALRLREQQMRAVVESAMDAIVAVDAQMRIVLFNAAATRTFGHAAHEILGQSMSCLIPAPLRERHQAHMDAFRAAEGSAREMGGAATLVGLHADGREFPVEATIARSGQGASQMFIAVVRDITERRQAEEAVQARQLAEQANRAKTDFLSRVSHELRTPLNGILGFAELLLSEPDDAPSPQQQQRLMLIRRSGHHLLSLIDDMLDLSRIEQGAMRLTLEPVCLGEVLRSTTSVLSTEAREKDVTVMVSDTADQLWVLADRRACGQILLNLLANAIKYNHRGGHVRIDAKNAGAHSRVAVSDSGAGMRPDQVARLYEPFNRLGAEATANPGTGLGLVISRELALAMQGQLDVESAVGVGSTFVLSLPIAAPTTADAATCASLPPPAQPGGAGRVLYIEDDPVNALLMEETLRRMPQWTLEVCGTGAAGLSAARRARPDVIITDMNLPDMSGLAVIRQLRAESSLSGVYLVSLSADAMAHQIERALAEGADAYWTKPVNLSQMLDILTIRAIRQPSPAVVTTVASGQ